MVAGGENFPTKNRYKKSLSNDAKVPALPVAVIAVHDVGSSRSKNFFLSRNCLVTEILKQKF